MRRIAIVAASLAVVACDPSPPTFIWHHKGGDMAAPVTMGSAAMRR